MENKKQTAVEWQFEKLFDSFEKFNNGEYTLGEYLTNNLKIRDQAKAMEKEQMMQLWKDFIDWSTEIDPSIYDSFKEAINDYYNETYTP
jgi:hypothetical protein